MERGNVFKPETFELPATGDTALELQECSRIEYVSIMISYDVPIQWLFAKDATEAADKFTKKRFFVYRGGDTQFEIPCRGKQPFFYVKRFGPGPAITEGVSLALVQGAER